MTEPWMKMFLLSPPIQTTQSKETVDVLGLRHVCENIIKVLSKQSPLHREGALLSRFVYKYDKKFRNDIGYRNIRKTNSTLHKYLHVNLLKDVESFTAVLPNEDEDFIPTRQMLEYILLRIITFSKLMLRVYVCSKQAAVFYLDRVKRGESHWMSLMPYSLLSRIYSMSTVLLQHSVDWYHCLHSYLTLLQPKGLKFLPDDYELPKNLNEWLDLKSLDSFGKFNWSQKKPLNIGFTLIDDEEIEPLDILDYTSLINEDLNEKDIDNKFSEQTFKVNTNQLIEVSHVTKTDYGQAISRDNFKVLNQSQLQDRKPEQLGSKIDTIKIGAGHKLTQESCKILTNFQKKISHENKSHYFGSVTNTKSLEDFLDKEEVFRNDGNKQSLTTHLSFMQWHTLKTSLLKVCSTTLNNRKIESKLQKVWKEKCLDYL